MLKHNDMLKYTTQSYAGRHSIVIMLANITQAIHWQTLATLAAIQSVSAHNYMGATVATVAGQWRRHTETHGDPGHRSRTLIGAGDTSGVGPELDTRTTAVL